MIFRLLLYTTFTILIYDTNCQWNQDGMSDYHLVPELECSESEGSCNAEDTNTEEPNTEEPITEETTNVEDMCTCDCDRCIGPDHCCVLLCVQCNSIGSLYFIPYPYPVVVHPLPSPPPPLPSTTTEAERSNQMPSMYKQPMTFNITMPTTESTTPSTTTTEMTTTTTTSTTTIPTTTTTTECPRQEVEAAPTDLPVMRIQFEVKPGSSLNKAPEATEYKNDFEQMEPFLDYMNYRKLVNELQETDRESEKVLEAEQGLVEQDDHGVNLAYEEINEMREVTLTLPEAEKVPERITEKAPERKFIGPQKPPETRVPMRTQGRASDRAPERYSFTKKAPQRVKGRFTERVPERFSEKYSGRFPERHQEEFPERYPERRQDNYRKSYPEINRDRYQEKYPERYQNRYPERYTERYSGGYPERYSGGHPDRYSGRHPERYPERNSDSFPERISKKNLERIPERNPERNDEIKVEIYTQRMPDPVTVGTTTNPNLAIPETEYLEVLSDIPRMRNSVPIHINL